MSVFNEANRDAATTSISDAYGGARMGFGEAFEAAYDAQARASSVLAVSAAFEAAEAEQNARLEKMGAKPPRLSRKNLDMGTFDPIQGQTPRGRFDPYFEAARYFRDGDEGGRGDVVMQADAELEALRAQYPDAGIKGYRELFADVQAKAKAAEKRWDDANTTGIGSVGGFLGGALASLDPRTDPFNFGTLPLAAGGASVAGRIAAQAGLQGATEAVNQFTGVLEQRRLLGLEQRSAAAPIALAAAGGAILQGAGEGVMALGRRWFTPRANDPAPPLPPEATVEPEMLRRTYQPSPEVREAVRAEMPAIGGLSTDAHLNAIARTNFDAFQVLLDRDKAANPLLYGPGRVARARVAGDLDFVGRTLDDWRGPLPGEVRPDTAPAPAEVTRLTYDVRAPDSIDARARSLDPETFNQVDTLQRQAAKVRDAIATADDRAVAANRGALETVEATLAQKTGQLERARSAKSRERLQAEIDDLTGQRDALGADASPSTTELRGRLVEIDEALRDLAPVLSRAFTQAKGQLTAEADSDAGRFLRDLARAYPQFRKTAAEAERMAAAPPRPAEPSPVTVQDVVPALSSRPEATAALPANADAADRLSAVARAIEAERDTATDGFRAMVARIVKPADEGTPKPAARPGEPLTALEDPNQFVLPSGRALHLDNDRVPSLDGTREVTVREHLQELQMDEDALAGVTSCARAG